MATRQRLGFVKATGVVLCLAMVVVACSGGGDGEVPASGSAGSTGSTGDDTGGGTGGDDDGPFTVRLTAGRASGLSEATPAALVAGDALDDDAVADIVERLTPFEEAEEDRVAFNRPPESLPRPRVGETLDQPFGPTGDAPPPEVADGPPGVVRHQPEGPVEVAPFISVTFDQPMVGLATLGQLDTEDVPVQVTPAVDGRWRWIGTRTLRFEHDGTGIDRLPAATDYTVEVPAGTEAANGATLAEAVRWSFATPPPRVQSFSAPEVIGLQPVLVAFFDQRIEPADVLAVTTLRAGGDEAELRLATDEEIADDDDASRMTEAALDEHWVAFTPDRPLPGDSDVTVEIGPGTPSAEGPRVSEEASTFETRTFAPLAVKGASCPGRGRCRPGDPVQITFNNPLDPASLDRDAVIVEPPVTARVEAFGNTVFLQGPTTANTTYQVTLPASLEDAFGQELGETEPVRFETGDARPLLRPFPGRLVTTDPMADTPSVSVTSIGHETLDVWLYAVEPADFAAYDELWNTWDRESLPDVPGWRQVSTTTVEVAGDPDQMTETRVDLSDAVDGASGHVVAVVRPTDLPPARSEDRWSNQPTMAWVQATRIGLDALADHDSLVAWATDLRDGAPLADVAVGLGPDRSPNAVTGADGVATMALGGPGFLVAERGDDSAVLDGGYAGAWEPLPLLDTARWYVIDDRQLYRPGEDVRMKGWVRRLTRTGDARITRFGGEPTVRYVARDAFGNEVASGETALDGAGGFELTVALPVGAALGQAWVELNLQGGGELAEASFAHEFQVEEFRRPEFEVLTRAESPEPHVMTEAVTVAAQARYFAGGVLADAPVTWQVTTSPTSYAPPNWSEFTFGVWRPWWFGGHGAEVGVGFDSSGRGGDSGPWPPPEQDHTTYRGRTDAGGTHLLQLDFEGDTPDQPVVVAANAAVEDVNRQSFASTLDLLVHPASRYVGLRSDRAFVRQGDPLVVEAIVTTIDGDAVAGQALTVTAARVEERFEEGEWQEVDVDPETCEVTSGSEPVTCSFSPGTGGRYRIATTVSDDDGGRNRSELTVWVSGADAVPDRGVRQQQLTIIPDQEEHQPGDTAELLVVAPFAPAHGLVTTLRNGIEEVRSVELEEGSTVVELAVTDADVPGFEVRVDVVGAAPRQRDDGTADPALPARPAFATGSVPVKVPASSKTLSVAATPADATLEPGATTTVELQVDDADGNPVPDAQVALVVVDEAVLSLVGYQLPDPIAAFYQPLLEHLRTAQLRWTLRLDDPQAMAGGDDAGLATPAAGESETTMADSDDSAGDEPAAVRSPGSAATADLYAASGDGSIPIDVRTNFDALAVFAPDVATGADGAATVEVTVPDNLTRYRVMAVATDGTDRFGSVESTITARLPLMVRPSPPRFVNYGDRFELPVVVHNQTVEPLAVDVVVEAANLALAGPAGTRVTVPAEERVEVRFPVEADDAGTARYRVTAVSAALADSASGRLPAYSPVTTEAFATYGVVDDGAVAQPLLTPTGVVPGFGGLEIATSSTALQALTDAVVYLAEYPYESADAYASRIIALVALRDVFAAFDAVDAPTPAELDATVRTDIDALVELQGDDGAFSTWRRNGPVDPYATVQATHALVAAGQAGYPVPERALAMALQALADIDSRFPPGWDDRARLSVSAYALHVRALAGDRDPAEAAALYRTDSEPPLDALAWLWPVVDDPDIDAAIATTFANRVTETASAATFATDYEEDAAALVLASDRRTDAIVLDALISERPDSDLIPKVVTGLIGNQVDGRWGNVQENGFVLLALDRYFERFEAATPSFVARAWLGDTYTAEHRFEGRSGDVIQTVVPLDELTGDPDVVVAKDGPGRLYYRLGLRYAPDDLTLDARDEGFVVDRTYEAVDDPDDVRRVDGGWEIEPGAMVRVRLTMVADARRTNMALVDALPAGLEVVSPSLAAAPKAPPDERDGSSDGDGYEPWTWPGWSWFDHQSFRDARAEAYASFLPAGTYDWSYVARATTPGTFTAPPARAEEIYAPEVFGRSSTDIVTVGS